MYLSERYLEILQNVEVEEPKTQHQKNGKILCYKKYSVWFAFMFIKAYLLVFVRISI